MGVKDWFVKKFAPKEAANSAAIDYITTGGFYADQVDSIPENDQDLVTGKANRGLLPHLVTRRNPENRENLTDLIENQEIKKEFDRINATVNKGDGDEVNRRKYTLSIVEDFLIGEHKIMFADSFKEIENKTVVLDKPYWHTQPNMGGGPPTPYNSRIPLGGKQSD